MRVSEYSFSTGRGYMSWSTTNDEYDRGTFYGPNGTVSVYAQGDHKFHHHTRLLLASGGRCHVRSFHGRRYSQRYCATLARRFSEEFANNVRAV